VYSKRSRVERNRWACNSGNYVADLVTLRRTAIYKALDIKHLKHLLLPRKTGFEQVRFEHLNLILSCLVTALPPPVNCSQIGARLPACPWPIKS
jgi:hypothetical protein